MPVFNRHQQRNTVEQLVEEFTHYKINRRQFMQRAMAVGLSTSAAVSLLEACGGSSTAVNSGSTPTTVKSIDSLVVISGTELDNYNARQRGIQGQDRYHRQRRVHARPADRPEYAHQGQQRTRHLRHTRFTYVQNPGYPGETASPGQVLRYEYDQSELRVGLG